MTLGQPDSEISQKLKIGDIVTFTYEYHSRVDVPVNPQIMRVRQDLTWRDVLRDNANEMQKELNGILFS